MKMSPQDNARQRCIQVAVAKDRGDPYPFCSTLIKRFSELRGNNLPGLILDLGCGVGHNTICLSQMGFLAFGIDVLPEIIAEANKKNREQKSGACFVCGVGEFLPFKNDSLDSIILVSVLEHVSDWRMVIGEICRVLKPEGLVSITTSNRLHPCQGEVKRFPFFHYLPQKLRDKIINRHPALVDYALFPARHWFTPGSLSKALIDAGFSKVWDVIDIVKREEIPKGIWQISKPFLPLIKKLPHCMRFPFYLFIGGTSLWARK